MAIDKSPNTVMTGQERNDLRAELVDIHGFSVGQATSIVNANNRANMVEKMIMTCRSFPNKIN